MRYTYWLHEKVQTDLDEGFEWYEGRLEGLGYEFLNTVEKKIIEIVAHPETFGSKQNPAYREALLKRFPYVIVYRIYKEKRKFLLAQYIIQKKFMEKISPFLKFYFIATGNLFLNIF